MSTRRTIDTFNAWRRDGEPLVMATVVATEGSTYSKAGHRILIAGNGDYQGLVSGGCLEGDLAEHARAVIETGQAQAIRYDLRDEADEIWGMGIGCNGVIEVLLQRLDPDAGFEPFATIADCAMNRGDGVCVVVVASEDDACPVGATLIDWPEDYRACGLPAGFADRAKHEAANARAHVTGPHIVQHDSIKLLVAPIRPVPQLLILGAGPDAAPLVNMAGELGWRVTLADHRAAYLEQRAFDAAERKCHIDPERLDSIGDLERFTAAVVMSHHLATDRLYLEQLAATPIGYIGLLGPAARRERLVSDLAAAAAPLDGRLHGPVGMDIGADSPESIALAILAQIHSETGA